MHLIEAIILGLVQGLTEFLPVSSSAHVRIVGEFLPSAADPGATFTAIMQIGTELAVLLYFRKKIARVIGRWAKSLAGKVPRNDPDARMGWLVILGSIPIVLLGYFGQEWIRGVFRNMWLVAIVLIVFGILLGIADALGKRTKELDDLTYPQGVVYGFAQALALIPGVSRSGATTTVGRAMGFSRTAATEYSFLLAIPAVFGSGLYELVTALKGNEGGPFNLAETAVATLVAFVVGYLVIAYLMRYLQKGTFLPFVIYRIALGVTLMVLLGCNVLSAF